MKIKIDILRDTAYIYVLAVINLTLRMFKKFRDLFRNTDRPIGSANKNRERFDSIISDKRFNYLENIYQRLFAGDKTLADTEVLDAYFKFSAGIQTNTFAAAELEWVTISVLCHFRPNLTETLIRRGLLSIVYSFSGLTTNAQHHMFIHQRIKVEAERT